MPFLSAMWCPVCERDWAVSDEIFLPKGSKELNIQCSKCGRFGFEHSTQYQSYEDTVELLKAQDKVGYTDLDSWFSNGRMRWDRIKEIRKKSGKPQQVWEDEEYLLAQTIMFFRNGLANLERELASIQRLKT